MTWTALFHARYSGDEEGSSDKRNNEELLPRPGHTPCSEAQLMFTAYDSSVCTTRIESQDA